MSTFNSFALDLEVSSLWPFQILAVRVIVPRIGVAEAVIAKHCRMTQAREMAYGLIGATHKEGS